MKNYLRDVVLAVGGLLSLAAGLYLIKTIAAPTGILLTLPYILVGIGCGVFGHGVGNLCNRKVLENHPAIAKQQEIEQKDERNVALGNAAKAKAYNAMTYVFGALMIAYALMGVSFAVLLPFVVAYLAVQFYAIYYRLRMEKQL